MKFQAATLVLFLVVFTTTPRALADAADEQYLRVSALIEQGKALAAQQPDEAKAKYREAQAALLQFQKAFPSWNNRLVTYRLNDLAERLGEAPAKSSPTILAPAARSAPASTPTATTATVPTVGGRFPKMPAAPTAFVVDGQKDSSNAKRSAWALQGLINQQSAEVYVLNEPWSLEQLKFSGKPYEVLPKLPGADSGFRTLFQKYHPQVKKLFVYDPDRDWTWYLALMSAAQQSGLPVTEEQRTALIEEFGWKGDVQDFRNRWPGRMQAYDWALVNLMPGCSKQVMFALRKSMPLADYAMASKGFVFWLSFKDEELAQVKRIFGTRGYTVGTSLMGYASSADEANAVANPFGIGYVVSDLYANGSFWSSFPNKTYTQSRGKVFDARPGKVYAHIMWSDGDNIQFDQNPLFQFWHDRARGKIPVATQLSPSLVELNTPLLDWYYEKMSPNDELVCGPTGFQFIFIRDYPESLFPAWCRLTRDWCAAAGLHSARIWIAPNPSRKFTTYMTMCGFDGLFGEGWFIQRGFPPKIETYGAANEEALFREFKKVKPNPNAPVFCGFTCIVGGFNKPGGGFSAVKRQIDRLEKENPGVYEFVLPKDQFATIRALHYR